MYILKHYFKTDNTTDKYDLTKFGTKIGPPQDLKEHPSGQLKNTIQ